MSAFYQCSICNTAKNKNEFSKNQWSRKENRKCKHCIKLRQLKRIDDKQVVLFEGYMRLRISKQAPMDVINLCFMFYQTNLQNITTPTANSANISSLANECLTNGDYFIAYQLAKNVEMNDKFNNGHCHLIIGQILMKWKKYKKAGFAFETSLNITEPKGHKKYKFERVSTRSRAIRHYHYGLALKAQQKYDIASEQFDHAFTLSNRSKYAYQSALCRQQMTHGEIRRTYYKHAMKQFGQEYKYRYQYGTVLVQMKKYKEALLEFEAALILLSPKSFKKKRRSDSKSDKLRTKCIMHIVECHFASGDFTTGEKRFLELVSRQSDNILAYLRYAHYNKDYKKDYKEAQKYYLKCLEIDDKYEEVNSGYGHLLYLMGDIDGALKYAKMELEAGHTVYGYVMYQYGHFNYLAGNIDKGDKSIEKVLQFIKSEEDTKSVLFFFEDALDTFEHEGIDQYLRPFIKLIKKY